jgi:putative membrane protein
MVREIHRLQGRVFLALAIACSVLSGCGSDESATEPPARRERPMESLSEGQIVGIVNVINQGEMKQAEMALDQLKDESVRNYAETMMKEHREAEAKLASLLGEINATSESSLLQKELDQLGQIMTRHVDNAAPEVVDALFLEVQVLMHQRALKIVEEQLLPQAKQPELKAYLENLRTEIREHLARATNLQKLFPEAVFPK